MEICGKNIELGDYVRVRYTTGQTLKGGTIEGKIIKLWSPETDNHHQAQVESGWCFHDHDEIVEHTPKATMDGLNNAVKEVTRSTKLSQ